MARVSFSYDVKHHDGPPYPKQLFVWLVKSIFTRPDKVLFIWTSIPIEYRLVMLDKLTDLYQRFRDAQTSGKRKVHLCPSGASDLELHTIHDYHLMIWLFKSALPHFSFDH